jgi:hypothetical protein
MDLHKIKICNTGKISFQGTVSRDKLNADPYWQQGIRVEESISQSKNHTPPPQRKAPCNKAFANPGPEHSFG